jgi:hypothetical protein
MSYKLCFFAMPANEPLADVLQLFANFASELADENGYEQLYLVTNTVEEAKRDGLWLLHLLAAPAPYGRVSREFFTERLERGSLITMVYDDQHGIFCWEQTSVDQPDQGILTDAHRVGTYGLELTVDYPQRGFTSAQLDEALKKPEEELTEAEARALMEYDDALTIGLRQYGSTATRASLFALLRKEGGWPLLERSSKTAQVKLPKNAGPVADFYIEHYTFNAYGLEPRRY